MIIIRLVGGLGNQLFQYALGRKLSYINNVELKLDISNYKTDSLRSYQLDKFNIVESIASKEEIAQFVNCKIEAIFYKYVNLLTNNKGGSLLKAIMGDIIHKSFNINQFTIPFYRRQYIIERSPFFDPDVLKVTDNAYFVGYWNSYKYFEDIEQLLKKDFTLKNPCSSNISTVSDQIQNTESVSIHIRRGDYLTNKSYLVLSLNYYHKAIEELCHSVTDPHFFIFSDEPTWVENNFSIPYPMTLVKGNGPDNPHVDLILMSMCKHHIIANSTFSWWGAWLGTEKNKQVYFPKSYYSFNYDLRGVNPESWSMIDQD